MPSMYESYFKTLLAKCDMVFLEEDNTAICFVQRSLHCKDAGHCAPKKGTWWVHALCGKKGSGKRMLSHVIDYGMKRKLDQIQLAALFDVITYYKKNFGFKVSYNCEEDARVAEYVNNTVKQQRSLDAKDVNFACLLVKKGLGVDTKPCSKTCHWNTVSKCQVNGYIMTLCLSKKTIKVRKQQQTVRRRSPRLKEKAFKLK